MIQRSEYLDWLKQAEKQHLIKIISGIRRAGKSTLFELFRDWLTSQNDVMSDQIISINFEEKESIKLYDWEKLYDHVNEKLNPQKKNYVFLDEVQNVQDFQRAVDALYIKKNVDLYLTGSNSKLGVGEWATMFRGRYIELKILPLSFREYVSAYPFNASPDQMFEDYLNNSSFPQTTQFVTNGKWNKQLIKSYLDSLYDGVIVKDVICKNVLKWLLGEQ